RYFAPSLIKPQRQTAIMSRRASLVKYPLTATHFPELQDRKAIGMVHISPADMRITCEIFSEAGRLLYIYIDEQHIRLLGLDPVVFLDEMTLLRPVMDLYVFPRTMAGLLLRSTRSSPELVRWGLSHGQHLQLLEHSMRAS